MTINVKTVADKARNSISRYCMEECNSLCCRKGHITLNDEQMKLIIGDKLFDIKNIEVISPGVDKLCLDYGCPSFLNKKCDIHNNKDRPLICKQFPLFVNGNKIIVSHDCPAVEDNKLYPYLNKFKKMGFDIL